MKKYIKPALEVQKVVMEQPLLSASGQIDEIFSKGDYDHNIVPTTMVAYPSFRQLITLDVGLCKHVSMRIGYLGDYEQSDVNSIKHHIYSHRIMIGVVKSFQLIKHKP